MKRHNYYFLTIAKKKSTSTNVVIEAAAMSVYDVSRIAG
jgi:hypothetical protein